ncbi:hypothetical protein BH20ACT9_BH20ACT9_06080 [soil metagenome]
MTDTAKLEQLEAESAQIRARIDETARRRDAEREAREDEYAERVLAGQDRDASSTLDAETRQAHAELVEELASAPWFAALVRYAACRHLAHVRQNEVVSAAARVLGQEATDRVFLPRPREFSLVGAIQTALDEAVADLVQQAEADVLDRREAAVEGADGGG